MIAKVVVLYIAVIALCPSYINGICPVQENDTTVVLPYQKISSAASLNETTIKSAIQKFLARNEDFALISENPAISCKKIAELRPSYESGYYWIQGASGAVKVYCEMEPNNTFGQSQSGGWMRIANVDMRNNHSQCPPGLVYNVTEGRRLVSQAKPCSRMLFKCIQHTGSEI